MKKKKEGGFTLLELLIVIAIIAILSVALVIVLNPAEALKKSRDAQRISDMSTLKTAIGLYMTSVTPVYLGGASSNTACQTTVGTWGAGSEIFYSMPKSVKTISSTTLDGGASAGQTLTAVANAVVDGTGWLPVNFAGITGGSPISNLPIDPVNTIASAGSTVTNSDLVYRYACAAPTTGSPSYELDSVLESAAYNSMMANDGGNNANYYETGTNLSIIGTTTTF